MKKLKVIAGTLVAGSVLVLNSIGASAEWKIDTKGWWNSEGSSWSVGWKEINGEWYYFDTSGYMKTGWIQDSGKWYYLYSNGHMAKNTTIDGYVLGADGVWIQSTQNSSSNVKKSTLNSYKEMNNLPTNYTIDMAQKDGDVVNVNGIDSNIEKLDKFIDNYKNKKANVGDMVRITNYGDEGGAIIRDLIVDSDGIKLIEDNTRDNYTDEKYKIRTEYKVADLYKKSSNVIFYYAKTDTGEEMFLYCSKIH